MPARSLAHRVRGATVAPSAAIAAVSTMLVCLPLASGWAGLFGLLLAPATALVSSLALWVAVPQLLVVIVPALLPSPLIGRIFPWEIVLAGFVVVTALDAWRRREPSLWRLSPMEGWLLAFTGWALFTVFWSGTSLYYLLGMRRLFVGLGALWIAMRLPHLASRRWFDAGLICGATGIASAAIVHSLTSGFSQTQMLLHRTQVTDLGWGTANYVATLLLLCGPSLLRLVLRGAALERVFAGLAFALVTVVQFVVASRAATLLFVIGSVIQLVHAARRFRVMVGVAAAGAVAALVASPLGSGLLSRLGSLRELGSLTIRIWYFREGTQRLLENLPWGLGLGQGYANPDRLKGIDPHDYWLLIGGDLGIPGLLLWACVLVAIVRAWAAVRTDEAGREAAFPILLTFVLGNLHTLVEPTFQGTQYQFLFLWIVCGTLAYTRAAARRRVESVPAPLAVPVPSPA